MPAEHTRPLRDGKRCRFGHDWRVSFDRRFYYCYQCPAEWHSPDGSAPPQESYKSHPQYNDWAENLPEGASNTMPSKAFDDLLESDDDARAGTQESWMKVRDMLYEPIRVTRANIREEDDQFNPGKTRNVAYVHFYFLDDESETPFVFSSSASAILKTINRAVSGDEFPFDTAVIEVLSAEPFNGYFPLRFTSLGKLAAAQAALGDSNQLQSHAPAASAPETPPAPDATTSPKASTAVTAGKRSAPGVTTTSANTGARAPRSLATRGN